MMSKLNRLLSLLLVVSISISIYMFALKIFAERDNSKVEISVSFKEVKALANSLDKSPQEVLEKLKAAGVTSLAIEENTVKDLADMGWILVLNGWQLLDYDRLLGTTQYTVRQLVTADDFSPKSYYVLTKERDMFDKLKDFMQERGYDIKSYEGGGLYIIQDVKAKGGFTSIGLEFDETAFGLAQDAGLNTLVVSKGLASKTPVETGFLIGQLNKKAITMFLPGNNEMPLDNVSFRMLKGFLKDTNIKLGFDEFLNANDVASMAKELNYSAVRVYNRPPHKWMDEYLIAVRDRNDRLIHLHLFLSGPEDLLTYNAEHISRIKNDITTKGVITDFKFGSSAAFKNIYSSRILSLVSSLGIFWAIFRLAKGAGLSRTMSTILLAFVFMLLAIIAARDFPLFRNAAGLLAAMSFPVLGTYEEMRKQAYEVSNFNTLLLQSLRGFCRSTVTTVVGIVIVWGIFSGSPALLGFEKFRGIKALYIISYVLLILLYLKDKNGGFYLKKPIISLGGILGLVAFTGALFVLINRTGNYSTIPIPKWELSFRIWLEQVLWVRPRTKEFLIGFPSMITAGGFKALGFDKWSKLFYMVALLGQVSMMNTFSHFHISALISIIRSLEGIIIGLILGTVVLGGFYLYEKRRKGDA
jgi:hypothetical protein